MHFFVKLDDRKLILKLLMHENNIFTHFLIFPLRLLGRQAPPHRSMKAYAYISTKEEIMTS